MTKYPNAVHNLAKETDEVLLPWLAEADEFFQKHNGNVTAQEPITNYKGAGEECFDDLECASGNCVGDWAFDIAPGRFTQNVNNT